MANKFWKLTGSAAGGFMSVAANWVDGVAPITSSAYDFYFTGSLTAGATIRSELGQYASSFVFGPAAAGTSWTMDLIGGLNNNYFMTSGSEFVFDIKSDTNLSPALQTVFNTSLSGSASTNVRKKGTGDLLWRRYRAVTDRPANIFTIEDGLIHTDLNIYNLVNIGDSNISPIGRIGFQGYTPSGTTTNSITYTGRYKVNQNFQIGAEWWSAITSNILAVGGVGDSVELNSAKSSYEIVVKNSNAAIYGDITGSSNLDLLIYDNRIITINGNNLLFTGDITPYYGTASFAGNGLASSSLVYNVNNASLVLLTAGTVLGGLKGDQDLTSSVAYSVGNASKNEIFQGSMQGAGAVTKLGTEEWFNYNSSYSTRTGATTVTNGAFYVGYDDTLGQTATGGLTINNSGSIKFKTGSPVAKAWSIGGTPFYYTVKSGSYGYGNPHVVFEAGAIVSSSIILTSDTVIDIGSGLTTFTGSSTISSAGYSLYFDNNSTSSNPYTLNILKPLSLGSGSLGVNRSGVVPQIYLSGSQTIAGYVFNDGGNFTINHASTLISSSFSQKGGELNFDENTSATIGGIYSCSANIYTNTNLSGTPVAVTIGTTNISDGNYYGNIYGGGSLIKRGAGVLILKNSNTYTGTTTVSTGTLGLASITSIASSSQITVAASGNLQAQPVDAGGNVTIPCSILFTGGSFSIA